MIVFCLVFVAVFGVPAGGLGWYMARRRAGSKAPIMFLAALPAPALAVLASIASIVYGIAIKGTCGYDDCGGFIFIGILGIASAFMGYCIGVVFALVGAVIGRAGSSPPPDARRVID